MGDVGQGSYISPQPGGHYAISTLRALPPRGWSLGLEDNNVPPNADSSENSRGDDYWGNTGHHCSHPCRQSLHAVPNGSLSVEYLPVPCDERRCNSAGASSHPHWVGA